LRKRLVVAQPTTPINGSMEGMAKITGSHQPKVPNVPFHNPEVDPSFLLIEGRGHVENFLDFMQEMHEEIKGRMHECVQEGGCLEGWP
jgi:hypothetical protein